ncbi:MAG: UbiH/UbiF/VisC/COQ6 family ubiquinone biosynthesis hydroxylase [Alphaproteobacteria bacterium]|nr:UbiH/UbiF/VisC/COQ6 family ubiquinone biosynthesis hydroxylase [Alphaproteobacteria bacterium]
MSRKSAFQADIIIVGGGPSGLSLATSLGAAGLETIVLERAVPPAKNTRFDGRTLALSFRSAQVLKASGVWPLIEPSACPILDIRIADQNSRAYLDFHHKDIGNPFGWIVEHHLFRAALEKRVHPMKAVRVVAPAIVRGMDFDSALARTTLEDGQVFSAPLVIGADGRNSACREAAGIETYGWDYGQTAIACVIRHSLPHQNIAVEHFHPGGPFATLPMTKQRTSIVWTEKTKTAEALMEMNREKFTKILQTKVEDWLGDIELLGEPFVHPVSLQHAKTYTAPRLALIGDAAHSIHPIAGQGFNLGMGDIEALTDVLAKAVRLGLDLGSPDVLRRYEKRRKAENGNMVLATDGLVRLFSNAILPMQAARRFGLGAVQNMPALKRFFMRTAMGIGKEKRSA